MDWECQLLQLWLSGENEARAILFIIRSICIMNLSTLERYKTFPCVTWEKYPSALSNVVLSDDVIKKIAFKKKVIFLWQFSKTNIQVSRKCWYWMSCFSFSTNTQDKVRLGWGGINDNEIMKIGGTCHADYFDSFHHNTSRDYS